MSDKGEVEGVVQEFEGVQPEGGGPKKIKVDGKWYWTGNTVIHGVEVGDKIGIEWEIWSPPGKGNIKLPFIQRWGKIASGDTPKTPAYQPTQPQGGQLAANPQPQPAGRKAGMAYEDLPRKSVQEVLAMLPLKDADYIRMVSNVVGQAITAGHVRTPSEACRWIFAASCAALGVQYFESDVP